MWYTDGKSYLGNIYSGIWYAVGKSYLGNIYSGIWYADCNIYSGIWYAARKSYLGNIVSGNYSKQLTMKNICLILKIKLPKAPFIVTTFWVFLDIRLPLIFW